MRDDGDLGVDADWLTDQLRDCGLLPSGRVRTVTHQPLARFNSTTDRLVPRYTADTPASAPVSLVLKRPNHKSWTHAAIAAEARFYRHVAGLPQPPPGIVPCHASVESGPSGPYLLLADLTATHRPPVTREQQLSLVGSVPDDTALVAAIDCLAAIHAYWWLRPREPGPREPGPRQPGPRQPGPRQPGPREPVPSERRPGLGGGFGFGYWSADQDRFEAYLDRRGRAWAAVRSTEPWLPSPVCRRIEAVLAGLGAHWRAHRAGRFAASHALTLSHGDCYLANFLCPDPPSPAPAGPATTATTAYLLDWQDPGYEIPGEDLANLVATFWTRAQRQYGAREQRVLRGYHAALVRRGVVDYTLADLHHDYRLGLIYWLLVPIQDAADGSAVSYWWPKLQCLIDAYDDWNCAALIG